MRRDVAALLTGGAMVAAQLVGRASSPTPDHPRTKAWYASLRKPSYTPPGPVFGVVWTVLDGLMWFTGYRLLTRAGPGRGWALTAWLLNVAGIGGYPWVFFGRRRPDAALGVTAAMLGTSAGLTAASARVDRPAALASAPLMLWIAFATLLQEEVWRRNRD